MNNKAFYSLLLLFLSEITFINAFDDQPNWQEFKYRGGMTILDYSTYLTNVGKRTVEIFEQKHVSGGSLPILDQNIYINETVNEFNVEGTIILFDGFVNKIKSITDFNHIDGPGEEIAFVKAELHVRNVSIFYDAKFIFKDYEGTSMLLFTFDDIKFQYQISQDLKTKAIVTNMDLASINCKAIKAVVHPFGHYAQMGLKGIENSGNAKFCDNIKKSIQRWNLYECLQKAVEELGFPRVCYYC